MKKAIFIILIVLASLLAILGICYALLQFNDFHIEAELLGQNEITIEYGDTFDDPGATASFKGKLFLKKGKALEVETESTVDLSKVGEYEVKYSSRFKRHYVELSRKITVVDTKVPSISMLGDAEITLTRGEKYSDPGCEATDNYDGEISSLIVTEGTVDTSKEGEYTVTYSIKDSSGNESSTSRKVTVKKPPEPKPVFPTTVYPGQKTVYLTFDDGPGPYTAQLLDVLKKYNVKVTFFVVKTGYGDLLTRMSAEGHTVALHSATHNYKSIYSSEDAYFADLESVQSFVETHTGKKSNIIRFPGGSSNMVSSFNSGIMTRLVAAVTQRGYRYFDWNVDSNDAGGAKTSAEVITKVTAGIAKHDVSVVLQHDIKKFSVEAVEEILKWGIANGYTFKALDATSPRCAHTVNN